MNIEEKKTLTRQKILDAALKIFSRKGFHQSQLDEIAGRAHIGKGTIYNYFESKEDLHEAVIHDTMEKLFKRILEREREHRSAENFLPKAIETLFEFFEEDPDGWVTLFRSLNEYQFSSKKKRGIINLSHLTLLEPPIRRAREEGLIHLGEAETEDFVLAFLGITGAFLNKWYFSRKTFDFRAKIPFMAQILLRGVTRP